MGFNSGFKGLNCLTLKTKLILRHIREHFTHDRAPLALPGNKFPTVTCSMTLNSLTSVKLLHIFRDSAGWNSVTIIHCILTGVKKIIIEILTVNHLTVPFDI